MAKDGGITRAFDLDTPPGAFPAEPPSPRVGNGSSAADSPECHLALVEGAGYGGVALIDLTDVFGAKSGRSSYVAESRKPDPGASRSAREVVGVFGHRPPRVAEPSVGA